MANAVGPLSTTKEDAMSKPIPNLIDPTAAPALLADMEPEQADATAAEQHRRWKAECDRTSQSPHAMAGFVFWHDLTQTLGGLS
jgi:hypothetical protein